MKSNPLPVFPDNKAINSILANITKQTIGNTRENIAYIT